MNHLIHLVGPEIESQANDVLKKINLMDQTKEEYSSGGPTSTIGPKLLSQHVDNLRKSFLNILLAGGETALGWKGYLEGAVTAGHRAAKEVTQELLEHAESNTKQMLKFKAHYYVVFVERII